MKIMQIRVQTSISQLQIRSSQPKSSQRLSSSPYRLQRSPVAAAQCRETQMRPAKEADIPALTNAIRRERMNPLGIEFERFVIAEDAVSGQLLGFGQLAPLGDPGILELRSLIVEPESRGAGVGRQLLQHLIERGSSSDIYITTLGSTTGFYEREGFAELQANAIPKALLFEWLAGQVVARLVANQRCTVMKRAACSEQNSSSS